MNFHQKLERMAEQNALNQRTQKTNTLHISLNFDPSEKHSNEKLVAIANTYMEKIGFADQPYHETGDRHQPEQIYPGSFRIRKKLFHQSHGTLLL